MNKLFPGSAVDEILSLIPQLTDLSLPDKITALNAIRRALSEVSPFRSEPVDCVEWVPVGDVYANDYNPNTVAPPEMELLQLSIEADGYTQPVVTYQEGAKKEVVDGFHRREICRTKKTIRDRVHGYLPVVRINTERGSRQDRIAATVRHNRARGKHGVEAMSGLVADLARKGWDSAKIGKELGMDADEVLRLRQVTGLVDLFADREFSEAWAAKPRRKKREESANGGT